MKRLYTVLSLILMLVVLVTPTVARAGDGTSASAAMVDGWTWDEL